MTRTEHIDGVRADNVLRQLHVDSVAYYNQRSLVGRDNCGYVGCRDPSPFGRYDSATCCISNVSPSYKPLDLRRWVAVCCSTRQGHRIAYPSLCRTRDTNLSWGNCRQRNTNFINYILLYVRFIIRVDDEEGYVQRTVSCISVLRGPWLMTLEASQRYLALLSEASAVKV